MPTKRFNYEWHIINAKEINAFTAGGQIFITTGIIDFAKSDDELACVIGHEIYHNELGHITDKLREMKMANNILGDGLGEIAMVASNLLTGSFNQENEAYCDMYGLDLAVKAGYNGCSAIDLWQRMSENENSKDEISKLFRSHPYSADRSNCIHHHIDQNYKEKCPAH
jgi:predicted Zn-dependent protease